MVIKCHDQFSSVLLVVTAVRKEAAVAQWLVPAGTHISYFIPISVIAGGRKCIWPNLLPCNSKSPTSVGTYEPFT